MSLFEFILNQQKQKDLRNISTQYGGDSFQLGNPPKREGHPPIRDIPSLINAESNILPQNPLRSDYSTAEQAINPLAQPETNQGQGNPNISVDGMPMAEQRLDLSQNTPTYQGQGNPNISVDGLGGAVEPNVPISTADRLAVANAKLATLKGNTAENNDKGIFGLLKDIGMQAIISGGETYRQTGSIGNAIGGMVGGGAYGAYNPAVDEQRKLQGEVAQQQQRVAELQKQQGFESNIANQEQNRELQKAKIENYKEGREIRKQQLADRKQARIEKLEIKRRDRFRKHHRVFDHKNATEAQIKELASFGETPESIGSYDLTHPIFKKVGGTEFKYNKQTGLFEETNLPKDESKELVDFEITDSRTGKTSKYRVSQEKAAGLQTQMEVMGMRVKLARETREDNQRHQVDMQKLGNNLKQANIRLKARLDEIKAEKDQDRKRTLQQDASTIQMQRDVEKAARAYELAQAKANEFQ